MKTDVLERKIERSENFAEKSFVIKANREAFTALSDGLYSDKIRAVIREISCNAYDAHVEAGNKDPFDVHLPTKFEPTFYVQDYGTGLSREDIESMYVTYFGSTKTKSNDVTGCFGLGSKSPFAYVDMFTVTSIFEGVKYVYSIFLNEQRSPVISFIHESETEEHSGLKVQFSVKQLDFNNFEYKSKSVFGDFVSKPRILGNKVEIKSPDYSIKNDEWAIISGGSSVARAIMGNVAYPVHIDTVDLSGLEKIILSKLSVDLFFDIGEIDVQPNREGLSYNEKTTLAIRKRIEDIVSHESKRTVKEVNLQKSYWDAVIWFEKQKTKNKIVNAIFDDDKMTWNGQELKSYADVKKAEYIAIDPLFRLQVYSKGSRNYNTVISRPNDVARVRIGFSNKVFLADCQQVHARIRHFLLTTYGFRDVFLVTSEDDSLIQRFKNDVGIGTLEKLSSVVLPKRVSSPRDPSAAGNFVSMKWHKSGNNADFWETMEDPDSFNIEDGGFYIPINRWKVQREGESLNCKEFLPNLNEAFKYLSPSVGIPAVLGVKKAKLSFVEKSDKWVNWITHVEGLIRGYALSSHGSKNVKSSYLRNRAHFGNFEQLFRGVLDTHFNENEGIRRVGASILDTRLMKENECELLEELAKTWDSCRISDSSLHNDQILSYLFCDFSPIKREEREEIQNEKSNLYELTCNLTKLYPFIKDHYDHHRTRGNMPSHCMEYVNAMTYYRS